MQFLISTPNCWYSTTSGPSFKVTVTEGFFCNVFIKPVTNSLFNYHVPINTTATSRQGKSTQERSCVGVCFIRWIRRSRPQINCMKALSRRPSPGLSISRKGISVSAIGVRIQYPCSLGSVNSDIQSSRDVLVSFRILVCVLWSEFSNRTASFSMSAGQHWSCNMWHFRPTLSLFLLVVTLIRPWKPKVCKYGVWLEMTCKLNL